MKQCPHCKKNIPDSAKVCPYCKTVLEKSYRPMKRTNSFPNYMYVILALILIFSPMVTTLLFGSLLTDESINSVNTPQSAITVGPLGEVNYETEVNQYYFGSLDDFEKLVTNSGEYVTKIKELENEMKDIVNHYGSGEFNKSYTFYVTNQNNIYSNLNYDIDINDEKISIEYKYDLSKELNEAIISYDVDGFSDFNSMKVTDDSYPLLKELITLINDDKEYATLNEAGSKFNELETSFEERSSALGNYGIGVNATNSNDKASMRILSSQGGYRLKITYRTTANLGKLI